MTNYESTYFSTRQVSFPDIVDNFFRMDEFIWGKKRPFLYVKMEFHGVP